MNNLLSSSTVFRALLSTSGVVVGSSGVVELDSGRFNARWFFLNFLTNVLEGPRSDLILLICN